MMGISEKLTSLTSGSSAFSGRSLRASVTFSLTFWSDRSRSASATKSITMTDTPSAESERISSISFRSLRASSRGVVTRLSISLGEAPG